jgi:poly(3-hydroxyalkanoate) synthetase
MVESVVALQHVLDFDEFCYVVEVSDTTMLRRITEVRNQKNISNCSVLKGKETSMIFETLVYLILVLTT